MKISVLSGVHNTINQMQEIAEKLRKIQTKIDAISEDSDEMENAIKDYYEPIVEARRTALKSDPDNKELNKAYDEVEIIHNNARARTGNMGKISFNINEFIEEIEETANIYMEQYVAMKKNKED